MFIQTEATPNPATLKFIPGREVMGDGRAVDFPDAEGARRSPLAMRLFAVDGVAAVFFGADFITVTKSAGEWQHLKPALLAAIMEHFTGGAPILFDDTLEDVHAAHEGEDAEIVREIKEVLDTRIRPAVAQDGGDITFQGYEAGIVYLNMQGSCAGCPSSTVTLKRGVENTLRHYVPEVKEVRAV
ncbi:MAG TPA: NifU family protein [Parvibaculum sp.]|uniref:NifU family protein n=1 Tax=Parvibaculum sp. TaxID=2024848 RepID=UPI002B53DAE9|nr:NifU family protein [Parvibaculum sp.]HMM14056.1 NifU family protein [Parvibaculum sp.]